MGICKRVMLNLPLLEITLSSFIDNFLFTGFSSADLSESEWKWSC